MNEQLLNRPLAQGKVVGRGRGGGEGVVASTTRVHPMFEVILARYKDIRGFLFCVTRLIHK